MKLNLKTATLLFSIGIGLSGVFQASVFAKPTTESCMLLSESCANGNQNACQFYQNNCLLCEVDPYACSEFCQTNPNEPMCG